MSDGHPKVMPGGAEGDGYAYDFPSRGITDERHLQHPHPRNEPVLSYGPARWSVPR